MIGMVLARLWQAGLTLLALSAIVFYMGRMTGSPAHLLLPENARPEEIQRLEEYLGLREPLYRQYGLFLARAVRGDLGESLRNGRPVLELFLDRFPATLQLTLVGMGIVILLGVPLGIVAALRRGGAVDQVVQVFAGLAQATPSFWLGLVLMLVFGVWLRVLPVAGTGGWQHTILPAVSLSVFSLAGVIRLMRSGMLDVLDQEFVTFARSKGLSERVVIAKHALRNALIPVVTFAGIVVVNTFLTGSVVVESVFAWPGVGYLAYESVVLRDFPTLQGVVLIFGGMFILANLAVDISYVYLDPLIRGRG